MPRIPLAFSTIACPAWDWAAVAARAKAVGYDGVELAAVPDDPATVRRLFTEAGVTIACVPGPGGAPARGSWTDEVRRAIDTAAGLGCGLVRVRHVGTARGRSGSDAALALGDQLSAVADDAAAAHVTLLLQNTPSLGTARALWGVLDRVGHPRVAACWDALAAAGAGESPAVAVPTLNSRIQHVHVADATLGGGGAAAPVPIGQGQVPIETLIRRLQGIGYGGYVTLAWDPAAWAAPAGEAEAVLAHAVTALRAWTEPPRPALPKRKSDAAPSAGAKASPGAAAAVSASAKPARTP
ncbi:MAG TPA: TIM barrel protein [Tepidisphaeraceae bacterium]|nr:TIM barrel protein [Tepidisphaeraceae bacterium]